MIKLRWKDRWIPFESVEWSGTDTQCSRQITFTIPNNPYDKQITNMSIKLGDLMYLYDGKTQLFVGTVTSREKTAEIGTATYTAKDFMHHLLRSYGTYIFRGKTPEQIAKKACQDVQVQTSNLAKTGINIPKLIIENKSIYDIIICAYRRAMASTKKKYIPVMNGKKVSVITKGKSSGVTLTQGINVTAASYTDTTDNMIDSVVIYSDKKKKLGTVQDKSNVSKYGVYQQAYTKEENVNAKDKAKSMFVGITKEASIEALGDVRAVSGYAINIDDKATGLKGKFYIQSDTHTFSEGTHTMSLGLRYDNIMEESSESQEAKKKNGGVTKANVTNAAKCYYLETTSVYHSSKLCTAIKGKNTKISTVGEMKLIKITQGKNKGKRKFKPCAKCWNT